MFYFAHLKVNYEKDYNKENYKIYRFDPCS